MVVRAVDDKVMIPGALAAATSSVAVLLRDGVPATPDRAALEAFGRALGERLRTPVVVTLSGDLGAGKTTLVRALCAGFGVTAMEQVTSPTFGLVQEYAAPKGPVVHADLYRLRHPRDLEALGWDEMVATAPVLLVEWPELAQETLPPGTIEIHLTHDAAQPERRRLQVTVRDGAAR